MRAHSKDGVWHPSKERVALKNNANHTITNPSEEGSKYAGEEIPAGADFIYEGPDRAFLFELYKIDKTGNTKTMGMDFHEDPDIRDRVRQMGYNSVQEYAKSRGYNKEKAEILFKANASRTSFHNLPKKVEMLEALESGGDDTAGQGQGMKGGFGDTPTEHSKF